MARIHSLPNRWEAGLTGATGLISQKENDKDSFFIPISFLFLLLLETHHRLDGNLRQMTG